MDSASNESVMLRSRRQLGATNQPTTPNTQNDQQSASTSSNMNRTTVNRPRPIPMPGIPDNTNRPRGGLSDGSVRQRNPTVLVPPEGVNPSASVVEEEDEPFHDASGVGLHDDGAGGDTNNDLAGMVKAIIRESLSQLQLNTSQTNMSNEATVSLNPTVRANNEHPPQALYNATQNTRSRGNRCKPPNYDGTYSWPDYLIQFNMIAELNGWDEHEKLLFLGGSLDGVAREVLGDIDVGMRNSFEGLVNCLEDRFGPSKKEEIFRVLLKNRVQKPNEEFPELAYGIRRMVRNTYPRASFDMIEQMSKDHFIDAIRDPNLQYMVQFKEPESLDEAVRTAIKLAVRERSGNKKSVAFCRSLQTDHKAAQPESSGKKEEGRLELMIRKVQQQVGNLAATMSHANPKKDWTHYRCHHCLDWGHIRAFCPKFLNMPKPKD